jgi:hypothetical protein
MVEGEAEETVLPSNNKPGDKTNNTRRNNTGMSKRTPTSLHLSEEKKQTEERKRRTCDFDRIFVTVNHDI